MAVFSTREVKVALELSKVLEFVFSSHIVHINLYYCIGMNIPNNVYRRVTQGLIMPPRSMTQMVWSAVQGTFSLFTENNRTEFIDMLENGTIQEGVISQATAGPVMMLSLFHDLQNPLFKRNKFDAMGFLQGVAPALENFHNVNGALENELRRIKDKAGLDEASSIDATDERNESITKPGDPNDVIDDKESMEAILEAFLFVNGVDPNGAKKDPKKDFAVLDHDWTDVARKDPDSLAGQLSRMVTKELFQIHQVNAKMALLLQNQAPKIDFREGSCRVNNVALLSARAGLFVERESTDGKGDGGPRYEAANDDFDNEDASTKTAVAAQLEILYDVTQEFLIPAPTASSLSTVGEKEGSGSANVNTSDSLSAAVKGSEPRKTTIVSVALFEGWLKGGPDDGELRWKLALHRPPFEFPNIEAVY